MSGRKPRITWETPEDEQGKQSSLHTRQSIGNRTPRIYFEQPKPAPVQSIPYGSVILGLDTDTGQPIAVSQVDLCAGTYIDGVQRIGKTSLLEQIVYQQEQLEEAIIVIDPHGDLANSLVTHMPAHRLSKTYLLDLTDRKYPFGLNAFVCSDPNDEVKRDETRNQIMHAFAKLWPEIEAGQYFKRYLRHVVITLIEHPELTLANVERLLDDATYRQRYTANLKNSETRQFWQHYSSPALSDSKRMTETSPLRGRLDELLTEPVINAILRQTKKTVNIRQLIEERAILLVKLPVNQEAYKYSAPVIGTFLMAMIYAATFSFDDIPNINDRPGFTLIVDEFQNFATDEYAKLFEQGGKYKVKQFLAHQHREQLERGQTGKTNVAATLSANTIVAFRTVLKDSHELASLYTGIADRRRPTDILIHPLEKIDEYPHPTVKRFVLDVVDRLDKASGQKLATKGEWYRDYSRRPTKYNPIPERYYTYKVDPEFDFGAGSIQASPKAAEAALSMLDRLIYESEEQGKTIDARKAEFITTVTPFWKLASTRDEAVERAKTHYGAADFAKLSNEVRDQLIQEQEQELAREARQRAARFVRLLDTVLAILIKDPIANDATLSNADIAGLLEHLEKRHAFVKTGSTAYAMETRDTGLLQIPVTAQEAAKRLRQVREQTRARYCVNRLELEANEEEAQREETEEQPPQPEPDITVTYEPEPVLIETHEPEPIAVAPEPELQRPEPPARKAPEAQTPEPVSARMDTLNSLYIQFKAKEIDPDTTILASLGEHYVFTIRQWMRLFAWKTYPKATQHFKELRESGLIYRKDREGRGGSLVTGDWFFLLTKGANELAKRKQPAPQFKLEPNEADKASGDTLFHTYLVNEILIHLRLLERQHPQIVTIEQIDHERSMRRNYLQTLGTDTKLYPDGFVRLLVPTPNGLKRKYTFFELQHTTQKDKHNWQSKVRKYLDLFAHADTLEMYFHTRTPRVLVLTMDEAYVAYHKQWTEEVLAERGDRGRAYSNRFSIGAYDAGISDMSIEPLHFFCTPRFFTPFNDTPNPVFAPPEQTP